MREGGQGYGGQGLLSLALAVAAALALAAFGVARGTWAVGGSDSSCYALMAQAFAHGRLQPSTALVTEAPWPNAAITFAPGGFIPSAIRPDAAAPICAPGMSVLMAPLAALFGRDAIFWLTPIAAAVLVLSAFAIARQLAGGMAGATAAILTATSPIVIYQAVQPMNDIVTAALWLAAIALVFTAESGFLTADASSAFARSAPAGPRRSSESGVGAKVVRRTDQRVSLGGFLIGVAILVRPNLAPLVLVLAVMPFIQHGNTDRARRSLVLMIAGMVPGIIGLLALNRALYGSVAGSGYGSIATLFGTAHISDNLTNYGRSLWQTQNLVPAIALLAPFVFEGPRRKTSLLLLVFAFVVIAFYLLYQAYPEWWYLRFLIPAIVVLLTLASAVAVHLLAKAGMGGLIPIAAVLIAILGTRAAGERQAFELQRMEGRYRQTAELVRDRLPANAVLITEWQSGGMRFHAGREVVLWESLEPAWLDRALAWLRAKGLQPYVLVERREEPAFRARFRADSETGALDWPPRFDLNRQVRIFDPADRARFHAGEQYSTENIRSR
jgi:hypothetical protein